MVYFYTVMNDEERSYIARNAPTKPALETIANLKRAIKGEVNKVLEEALNNAGHKITFNDLEAKTERGGSTLYYAPSGQMVIDACPPRDSKKNSPPQRIYNVYSPQGHLASSIRTNKEALLGEDHTLECVCEIIDYNPPSQKQEAAASKGCEDALRQYYKGEARARTRERHMARELKLEHGIGPASNKKTLDDATSKSLRGSIRRERKYDIPGFVSRLEPIGTNGLTLNARITTESIHHSNGHISVTQYTYGGGYTTVRYDGENNRLSQTIYSSDGTLVKEYGKQETSLNPKKPRRPKPMGVTQKLSDREAAALSRVRTIEDSLELDDDLQRGARHMPPDPLRLPKKERAAIYEAKCIAEARAKRVSYYSTDGWKTLKTVPAKTESKKEIAPVVDSAAIDDSPAADNEWEAIMTKRQETWAARNAEKKPPKDRSPE